MSTRRSLAINAALITLLSAPIAAWGHGGDGTPRVDLHVGTDYEQCYFDLHSELTEAQFREFAAEGGQIGRSKQLSSADTLGKGVIDVSLGYALYFLDDTKGAWNNTMSHPTGEHYLGQDLGIPQLGVRVGVTDRVDAEVSGSVNPMSNYGIVGLASKIRLFEQGGRMPVSISVRPSVGALLGPSEVQVFDASVDLAVSRNIHGFSPFAGVTTSTTLVLENSDDTDVGHQAAARSLAFAGVEYRWKAISAAAQAEISNVAAVGLRVGGQF